MIHLFEKVFIDIAWNKGVVCRPVFVKNADVVNAVCSNGFSWNKQSPLFTRYDTTVTLYLYKH
mgnify:CR=1 FL=1